MEDRIRRFEPAGAFGVGRNPLAAIAEDLDGDGKIDVATANTGEYSVSLLLNETDVEQE